LTKLRRKLQSKTRTKQRYEKQTHCLCHHPAHQHERDGTIINDRRPAKTFLKTKSDTEEIDKK
jgi:hypothetical protein